MEIAEFTYYFILLIFFTLSLFLVSKRKFMQNIRYLLIWLLIFTIIFSLFSYREIFLNNRVIAQLIPGYAISDADKSVSFYAAEDGHFYANIYVNGVKIRFLLDTGASDIMLTANDARKIGINISDLVYDRFYHTAGGIIVGAGIKLAKLQVQDMEFYDINASVGNSNQNISLLGMDFFNLFAKYEFDRYKVVLYY